MTSNQFMFLLFSAVIVIFSVLTVTSRRILRAAIFLLFVLVSTAGLYFLLKYNFLAAIQLIVYAGGIVVLIIFSILLTSHIAEKLPSASLMKKWPAAIVALIGAALSITVILQYAFPGVNGSTQTVDVTHVGNSLINYGKYGYALPFEVISILLLAAMIGGIILAKKRKD